MNTNWIPIILLCSLFFLYGCSHENNNTNSQVLEPPVAVTVSNVEITAAPIQKQITGSLSPLDQAQIAARISGNIISMNVELGTLVNKGDTLLTISAREIEAQTQQAKAQLDQIKRTLAREEKLYKQNAATKTSVKNLQDELKMQQAAYNRAKTMLQYTAIKAPFSGIITQKQANSGDLATLGKILLTLESEALQVVTDIPESLMNDIQIQDVFNVEVPAAQRLLQAKVIEIAPSIDPATRSGRIKLSIDDNTALRSGQFAKIHINIKNRKSMMIPNSAIFRRGQLEMVYTSENGKAQLKLIQTGRKTGSMFEVLSGLNTDDKVITSKTDLLENGRRITIQ